SVWCVQPSTQIEHPRDRAGRACCLAVPQFAQKTLQLRHIVWIDPEWVETSAPSFERSRLQLAREFSAHADLIRISLGAVPFLRGTELAEFPWPMPAIPIPDSLQRQQWLHRYRDGQIVRGEVAIMVQDAEPASDRRWHFVQIERGPLLPLQLPRGTHVSHGDAIEVRLRHGKGCLQAHVLDPELSHGTREGDQGSKVAPEEAAAPLAPAIAFPSHSASPRAVPPARSATLSTLWPVGTILPAELIGPNERADFLRNVRVLHDGVDLVFIAWTGRGAPRQPPWRMMLEVTGWLELPGGSSLPTLRVTEWAE
ncbi:MAG TPA: hypothetical protein VF701_09385, partial [Thermoanaerobaculia bacterium]